jgi:hypothetical protein
LCGLELYDAALVAGSAPVRKRGQLVDVVNED